MRKDRSAKGVEALGGSTTAVGEDGALLALEAELDNLVVELLAAQEVSGERIRRQLPSASDTMSGGTENASDREADAKRVETILERLYPIERAIMAAPARTIVGLGVKARHAAYVMSQYWEEPAGKIDWGAQVVRLLIEAVCDAARTRSSSLTRQK